MLVTLGAYMVCPKQGPKIEGGFLLRVDMLGIFFVLNRDRFSYPQWMKMDDLWGYSTFSVPTGWNQNYCSICIQFLSLWLALTQTSCTIV